VQRKVIRDHLAARGEQRETGLVCVHGRAGLGSYSLAAEACGEHLQTLGGTYIEVQAAIADGRPVPLGEVLGQALHGLGVAEADLAVSDTARIAAYQRLSAGRRFVLLIKDAVAAEQVEPLIPSSAPDALVLVTSRRALRTLYARNFAVVQLDRLPAKETRELLISSLGPTAVEIDSGLIEELDRLCDGHPLLIRLVAAHLLGRARVAEPLVSRVRRSRAALLELDVTQPVTSSLTLAYEGLKDPLRQAYRRAALVPGPDLTPDVAAIACATDVLTATEMLDELVDANLLSVNGVSGRYTFHTVVREHARLRAREDEGDERCDTVIGRVVRWYLDMAVPCDAALSDRWRVGAVFAAYATSGRPRPPRDEAIEWFDREWRTVVACVSAAHGAAQHDVAWQLCVAVFKYLHMHGHTDAWLESHGRGIESARHVDDRAGVMQVTNQRGAAWIAVRAFRNARADFEESLAAAREVGHALGQQSNLEWLGKVSAREGDFDAAFVRYDESEAVIVGAVPAIPPAQAARMRALLDLHRARAHLELAAKPAAVAAVNRALDHFHAGGDERENRAKCLVVLGDALEVRSAAADAHREAAVLFGADGLRRAEAGALLRVGQLDEDPRRAREALERACELYAELGDPGEDEARAALDNLDGRPA
jgi:hypothetical protein